MKPVWQKCNDTEIQNMCNSMNAKNMCVFTSCYNFGGEQELYRVSSNFMSKL
jgi:hypothetical protein